MPQPDLVIFDCDGVLVDSEIIAARVDAELLTLAGYEISAEEISESYAGLTFKDIMLRVEEKSRIPFQASLIDREEQLVDRKLRSDVRAIDGA
ncbi:HAD family phosphatase, partial [Mesorhizobium sp. M7A.F.Ca.CA.002.15.1.1]